MNKYQIRFVDKEGHGFFKYVICDKEEAPKKAAEKATEEINYQKSKNGIFSTLVSYKPPRILHVWEWDVEKKEVNKKGHRFKLELLFIQFTEPNGRKVRDEWYEPIEK